MNLLTAAHNYLDQGLCTIPTNKDKRAFLPWKEFTERIITKDELTEQFAHPQAEALAILCGKTSGNLEVIDIDTKYDLTGTLYDEYMESIKDNDEHLYEKLLIIQTRSGGYHIYYRCPEIQGNQKLAQRETTEEERKENPHEKVKVLIETRGQSGYVLAPPSKGYKNVRGKSIPLITEDERSMILDLARSFNKIIAKPENTHISRGYNPKEFGMSPFDDYNARADVLSLLKNYGWTYVKENSERIWVRRPGKKTGTSGDILKENNWFSVFSTSCEFEINKAYLPYAVFAKLECNDDFKAAAKKLLGMGYGEKREYFGDKMERDLYKKKRDGMDKDQMIDYLGKSYGKGKDEAVETVDKLTKMWGEALCIFWDVSDSGKLSINFSRLIDFLYYNGGFSLYYYDKSSTIFRIVRSADGFVEEVSTEHIKKFLKGYIESLPDTFDGGVTQEDLKELILRGSGTYFSTGLLEFLNRSDFKFLKDLPHYSFIPFQNGVVQITKDSIELLPYKKVDKVIWKSQVIEFDILIEKEIDFNLIEYYKFLKCICHENDEKFNYVITLIGYLLHQHKDPTRPYSVILAEETENENKGGGTGKGIFVKALSKIIQVERIDGKNFKLDKSFAFQRVGLDTNIISIEDVRKNIDFEGFYSIITEGVTVEKKNKDELFIPYEDSPKIVFTTNYTVPSIGNHGKRRQKVFEFSDFFSANKTPEDYFGHKLFDDWDRDEWNRFYNLMFYCIKKYLTEGIKSIENSMSIKRKQIRVSYSEEFMEWMDNYFERGNKGKWWSTTELYKDFLVSNEFTAKDYSIHRFKKAIKTFCDVFNYTMEERRNRNEDNRKEISILGEGEFHPVNKKELDF